ncbi:esterase/lipase family protein [Paraherbaspirillum soli]|uniref:Esterase/lipase family protein n=1 Tax=Paraherbaspirillum soli TaxID=631222 RepID=A0ABW0MBI7_9BURK
MKFLREIAVASVLSFGLTAGPVHASFFHWGRPHPADAYSQTKYPIVLVHGLSGTSKYFGIIDYWWKIPEDLRAQGATVYVANVAAFNSDEQRGEALVKQIADVLAATGASKVNLIAHSQGGTTSRYAAAVRPEWVASVTTISTPHKGTPVADYVATTPAVLKDFLAGGASIAGAILGLFVGDSQKQDPLAALAGLTTSGAADFNRRFPSAGLPANCDSQGASTEVRNGNRQKLYSWAGNQPATNVLDVTDPMMALGGMIIRNAGGGGNDGLVPVCSARFGQDLGQYGWNHVDEINHLFGLRGLSSADPVVTIRTHANRLKLAGL